MRILYIAWWRVLLLVLLAAGLGFAAGAAPWPLLAQMLSLLAFGIWTTPKTWTAVVVTVADLNTHLRDQLNILKTSIANDGRISGEIMTFREEITTVTFSATPTFNLALSNNFKMTLTANVTAITISNWTASKDTTVKIRLTQDGTGSRTVVLPAGWRWSNSSAPTMPTGANKAMTIMLNSDDGGTTIFASLYVFNA